MSISAINPTGIVPRPRCAFLVSGDEDTTRECGIVARCYYVMPNGKGPRYWLCHRHDSLRAADLADELGLVRYDLPAAGIR